MDSQQAIQTIQGLKQYYDAYSEAFAIALKLLTDGYTVDQTRIDTDIEAYRNGITQQIDDLTKRAEAAEAKVAQLTIPAPSDSGVV